MSEKNLNTAAAEAVNAQESIEKMLAEPVAGVIDTNEPSDADNPEASAIVETPKVRKKALGVIVRYGANLFLPLACTFGGYVVLHGDSSPGGGFQGGVLIASAVLLVFLGYGSQKLSTTFKESFLHSSETVAEIMYIAIGLIGVIVGLTVSFLICYNTDILFSFNTFAVVLGVSFSAAVGIIFGWAPARKASNLNPIDALRSM